eukprot:TRINITY_DN5730_c0_g5_i2.p1 TRINITY_DN5730_c0_g5~~TRINITY_DN5730_c0_g5_i2.p1  ORF type:complete len:604 (+),score=142.52 TRINITY_DN5730_c0_g5_i2:112-1812(+)
MPEEGKSKIAALLSQFKQRREAAAKKAAEGAADGGGDGSWGNASGTGAPAANERTVTMALLDGEQSFGVGFDNKTLVVSKLQPGAAAARAGLVLGQSVSAVDGHPVSSLEDFAVRVRGRRQLTLTVRSGPGAGGERAAPAATPPPGGPASSAPQGAPPPLPVGPLSVPGPGAPTTAEMQASLLAALGSPEPSAAPSPADRLKAMIDAARKPAQPKPQEPPPQQPPPQPRGLDLDSLFGGGFSPVRAASTPEHAAPVLSFDPQPAPLELEAEFAACPAAAPDCPETIEVSVMLRERVDADLLAGEMQSYSLLAEVLALGKRPILDPGPPQPDDPPSTVVTFYLALEGSPHVEPDPKYVSSGPTPGSWTVRLRISDEEGPRRGAITLLRYRQGRNPQSALPVRARVVWQSAPAAAPDGAPAVHDQLTLDWKVNPAVRLESLGFLVDAGSSVAAPVTQESRPPGQWSRERRQLLWRAVENGQMSAPEGRLQARFLAAAAAGAPDTSAEELCAAHQQQRRAVLCRFKGDARGPMGGARVEFFRDRDLKLPLTLTGGVAHQFLSGGEFTLR